MAGNSRLLTCSLPQPRPSLSSDTSLSRQLAGSPAPSSCSSPLSSRQSSLLSTAATSLSSSSINIDNRDPVMDSKAPLEGNSDGAARVILDSERISDVMAARLVTCLLGHVLFLKGQVPFPIAQLTKMSERRRTADTNASSTAVDPRKRREQVSQLRAFKKHDEMLEAFDTLASHLKSTFSALSTALASNARRYPKLKSPVQCEDSVTDACSAPGNDRYDANARPAATAHVVFALGPSATNLSAARAKIVMEIEGLEVKIWGERDDGDVRVDSSDGVDNAIQENDEFEEEISSSSSLPSESDDDIDDQSFGSEEEDEVESVDTDDEVFQTDNDDSEDDSILEDEDEDEEDSIVSRFESLNLQLDNNVRVYSSETIEMTVRGETIEDTLSNGATPKASSTMNMKDATTFVPSLSLDSMATSDSSGLSSLSASSSATTSISTSTSDESNLSTPIHRESSNQYKNKLITTPNFTSSGQSSSRDHSPPLSSTRISSQLNRLSVIAPSDPASLLNAERQLSRALMLANAENDGLGDDIPPTQMHILIRAPRRFTHPSWVPQLNACKALDKLVHEACGSKSLDEVVAEKTFSKKARNKARTEVINVSCRCDVDDFAAESMMDDEKNEEDELIWWRWDGKLVGFSEW